MTIAIEQTQPIDRVLEIHHADGGGQLPPAGEADQLPPMTAEAAQRLAALLAPHLLAMRAVTAGTQYGAPAGADADPAARPAGTGPAALTPPASAATRIFIAGMLERISA